MLVQRASGVKQVNSVQEIIYLTNVPKVLQHNFLKRIFECFADLFTGFGSTGGNIASCTMCPAGKFTYDADPFCSDCKAGTFCTGGQDSIDCPAGRYTASTGNVMLCLCFILNLVYVFKTLFDFLIVLFLLAIGNLITLLYLKSQVVPPVLPAPLVTLASTLTVANPNPPLAKTAILEAFALVYLHFF